MSCGSQPWLHNTITMGMVKTHWCSGPGPEIVISLVHPGAQTLASVLQPALQPAQRTTASDRLRDLWNTIPEHRTGVLLQTCHLKTLTRKLAVTRAPCSLHCSSCCPLFSPGAYCLGFTTNLSFTLNSFNTCLHSLPSPLGTGSRDYVWLSEELLAPPCQTAAHTSLLEYVAAPELQGASLIWKLAENKRSGETAGCGACRWPQLLGSWVLPEPPHFPGQGFGESSVIAGGFLVKAGPVSLPQQAAG